MTQYIIKSGFCHNPLTSGKWANKPCPCGSKIKTKKCHGVNRAIPVEMKKELDGLLPEYAKLLDIKDTLKGCEDYMQIINKDDKNE